MLIEVCKDMQVKIGCLGRIEFDKGIYAYVGSAQNNLEKRIARHLSKKKKKFRHIDYLLNNRFTRVLKVSYKKARKAEECNIANKLSKSEIFIPDLGCS